MANPLFKIPKSLTNPHSSQMQHDTPLEKLKEGEEEVEDLISKGINSKPKLRKLNLSLPLTTNPPTTPLTLFGAETRGCPRALGLGWVPPLGVGGCLPYGVVWTWFRLDF